jgi:hypothetical protein
MTVHHMVRKLPLPAVGFALAACTAQWAAAATAPADPCSLLSAAEVSKTMGETYGAPKESVAPRPFPNTVHGTDCRYQTANGRREVFFRVYFDASAAQATELLARLKMWFGAGSTPASVGDQAYVDKGHDIHVRKGNVRYFISVSHGNTPTGQQQMTTLATLVAGKL